MPSIPMRAPLTKTPTHSSCASSPIGFEFSDLAASPPVVEDMTLPGVKAE